ncbi:hypothetical protein GCM10020220_008320 [Nonomuraea rubra]
MAAAASAAPARSSRVRPGERDSGMNRAPAASAATAIGTLTQKIARHPRPNRSASTSSPPSNGPATEARPSTAP